MKILSEQTRIWCEERNHPLVTHNPHLDRTWCRCGDRTGPGDAVLNDRAKWEIFHDHAPADPCHCYLPGGAS